MIGMVQGAAVALALFALYLLFAGEVSAVEIGAGLVCAGAGTALAVGLDVVAVRRFGPAFRLGAVLRPLAALLVETFVVGRELVRAAAGGAARGALSVQPFDPGGDDPRSATRRALTLLGISLAPRSFAIRGERGDGLLLHNLPAKPAAKEREWPA